VEAGGRRSRQGHAVGSDMGSQACEPPREGERKNGLSPVKRYRPRFKPMRIISNGFKYNSNSFKLDSVQKRSSELKKFEIKYCCKGFEIWNNFPYRNFHRFKKNLELEIREASRV
jgi:hypothetical protein